MLTDVFLFSFVWYLSENILIYLGLLVLTALLTYNYYSPTFRMPYMSPSSGRAMLSNPKTFKVQLCATSVEIHLIILQNLLTTMESTSGSVPFTSGLYKTS